MLTSIDFPEHISHSEAETEALGRAFARSLGPFDTVCMRGDLGMGKTLFCRALIRELCRDQALEVPSPTFTLVQHYDAAGGGMIWHFDLYRLEAPDEVYETGWEEAVGQAICLIEWPERLGSLIPARRIEVVLLPVRGDANARRIEVARYE